ncbi:alkaline phosphatase family protein [Candidatus Aenigmatarchaeota archaeon]
MTKNKFLLIVLDGAGDLGKDTPLEVATKPNIDSLAEKGKCGLLDIGYGKQGKQVNSDFGYLNILGCYSKDDYPGRGYMEALGVGLKPGHDELCIRANFATLDDRGNVKDRRAGRDETGLEGFCEKLDGMEIDGVRFGLKKSAGHRIVIVIEAMKGERLSDRVIPNDPFKTGVPLQQIASMDGDRKSKFTASVLNKFLSRSHKILVNEPANKKRKIPANAIMVRNIGRKKDVKSFSKRFGLSGCCVAGVPIAKGVSRFLDMDVIEVEGANGMPDTNLEGKFEAVEKALKRYDLVFLHINAPDILSHEAKRLEKQKYIERIDKEIGNLKSKVPEDLVFIITCDHRTESEADYKKYRHTPDPVPFLASGDGIKPNSVNRFDEKSCASGIKLEKNELIPYVMKIVK